MGSSLGHMRLNVGNSWALVQRYKSMPFSTVFSWLMSKRIHQIDLFRKYPVEVQNELLLTMLKEASETAFGKQYDFKGIENEQEFKQGVPLMDYEDLKPYVDRIFKGEQKVLWPTDTKWFAKSSGTTNDRSKYIPVSEESLEDCHFKAGKDLLALHVSNHPKSKIYSGKTLVLGGSSDINEFRSDSYSGDLSAIIIKNLPLWVEFRRIPKKEIALNSNWEEKLEQMARSSMDEDVTVLSGVPSWTLVLLHRILEMKGTDNLLDVWPNLELYMHGGVSFEPYKKQFEAIIPSDNMFYVQTYNASEGFFGVQDRSHADDMLLMLDYGIYYEFIEMAHIHDDQPPTIGLDEVKVGVNYEMIITTNAGLWRYRLGDTVVFTSTAPYRIQVSGRTKHFINVFGEELMIDNAEKALAEACRTCGAEIADYTAGPVFMKGKEAGGHEWIVEFSTPPNQVDLFSETLDRSLREQNSDYDAKRTNNYTLRPPLVHVVPSGTFYRWMDSRDKLGGQNKVPRLSNHRRHIESIFEHIQQPVLR